MPAMLQNRRKEQESTDSFRVFAISRQRPLGLEADLLESLSGALSNERLVDPGGRLTLAGERSRACSPHGRLLDKRTDAEIILGNK